MIEKVFWNLQYIFGQARWDTGITPPELVELVESGEVTPGRALDIGCGTGTNVIYLAQHGFEAVGTDIAWLAIRRARKKVRQAGVEATFHTAEILQMRRPDGPALGDQFDLAIDIGCLHGLPSSDRPAYAAMLTRVLRVGGLYLLYAWGPRKMFARVVGLTPDEAQTSFADDFHSRWIRSGEERGDPSSWYLFERRRRSSRE
jgi:cyclopropane fatty-acyl-phospholipid synthase-like methyltransferase